jgi:CDP-paratose 2-epimerase
MRVLVTGGAGFVGGNLCLALAEHRPGWEIVAFDNLHRAGSELNVPRLRDAGISFVQGDVRNRDEVFGVGRIDALVEASAEPSVLAGVSGNVDYLVGTNLVGAFNCLELCRLHEAQLVFLSTSRVYPVAGLRDVSYSETETRFELDELQEQDGVSVEGIDERFRLGGARTLYGGTKLAAELLITEYADTFGLRAAVDRCGVVAGPWQMGRVDQGVVAHWVFAHRFGRTLSYIGFGGTGKQVRDVLHVDDLVALVVEQLDDPDRWAGTVYNVGGGREGSVSLRELTALCRDVTGAVIEVTGEAESRPGDVPIYVSDCSALFAHSLWRPRRTPRAIVEDIVTWVDAHEDALRRLPH